MLTSCLPHSQINSKVRKGEGASQDRFILSKNISA